MDTKELAMFPGLISGLIGDTGYRDIVAASMHKEPGMSPKQYGIMLSMRRRSQRSKRRRRRRK